LRSKARSGGQRLYFLRELRGKAARIKEKERVLASVAGATQQEESAEVAAFKHQITNPKTQIIFNIQD